MTFELCSISPSRLARLMAWMFGAILLLFTLIAAPMILIAPFPDDIEGQSPKVFFVVMLLLYPIFGALWGWLWGQVTARIYNFVASKVGGITFEASKLNGAVERAT